MSVASSSAPTPVLVQAAAAPLAAPRPTASQVREQIVEKSANLVVTIVDGVFTRDFEALAKIGNSGEQLPEGSVTTAFRVPNSTTNEAIGFSLRPKLLISENVLTSLESDVKGLSDPQAALYNAVLTRSITKIRAAGNLLLSVQMVVCEPEIRSGLTYDFTKSAILRSKVVTTILQAPSKVLNYFQ